MAPPSVWTTPGVRGLEADVDDTVVVLLGPAVVVLVVVLVGEDVLELLDEDELDDDELLDVGRCGAGRDGPHGRLVAR